MSDLDELRARVRAQYGEGIPPRVFAPVSEKAPVISDKSTVTLRLPWSCLVSDNDKFVAFLRRGKPAMRITPEYATAKERITALARDRMGDRAPLDCPLAFTARVWYPSNHPRDLTNWCKLVQDALSGVVYADDRLLRDVRWTHAGVDVDAPHAQITITPHAA